MGPPKAKLRKPQWCSRPTWKFPPPWKARPATKPRPAPMPKPWPPLIPVMPVIGYLSARTPKTDAPRLVAFRRGLQERHDRISCAIMRSWTERALSVRAFGAMLDGSEHQITNVLTADPTCGSEETHGLAITAIEREGDPHPLTVVAADLKAIGAPAAVARIDGDASVMSPLNAADMAIKQQVVGLHHPVNPLVIGRLQASGQRLALEDGVDTPVAVGRQLGDDRLNLRHEFVVWQRRPANPFLRSLSHAFDQIGAGVSNHLRHGFHREPSFGGDGGSRNRFFDPVACSNASLRISASSVFLPSSRCSSRTWLCKAR